MGPSRPSTSEHALQNQFGLADTVVDEAVLAQRPPVPRARHRHAHLAQLAEPGIHPAGRVGDADPQRADPRNLWRVHWYNDLAAHRVDVPEHVVLPRELDRHREPGPRRARATASR